MSGQTTTDFTHEWANRHDVGCERREPVPLGCLDNRACHCYRRWLEGRLGEVLEELKRHVVPVPKETPSC